MNDTGQQNIADPLFTLECPNGQPIKTWIFRAFSREIVLVPQTTDINNKQAKRLKSHKRRPEVDRLDG